MPCRQDTAGRLRFGFEQGGTPFRPAPGVDAAGDPQAQRAETGEVRQPVQCDTLAREARMHASPDIPRATRKLVWATRWTRSRKHGSDERKHWTASLQFVSSGFGHPLSPCQSLPTRGSLQRIPYSASIAATCSLSADQRSPGASTARARVKLTRRRRPAAPGGSAYRIADRKPSRPWRGERLAD